MEHQQRTCTRYSSFEIKLPILSTRNQSTRIHHLSSRHWLPVLQRIEYKNAVLTYKSLCNQAPTYLCNLLHTRQSLYNLRSTSAVVLNAPQSRTNVGPKAFAETGPKCWNRFPQSVRLTNSLSSFKSQLKPNSILSYSRLNHC